MEAGDICAVCGIDDIQVEWLCIGSTINGHFTFLSEI